MDPENRRLVTGTQALFQWTEARCGGSDCQRAVRRHCPRPRQDGRRLPRTLAPEPEGTSSALYEAAANAAAARVALADGSIVRRGGHLGAQGGPLQVLDPRRG